MSIVENILIVLASIIATYISLRFVWSFSKTLTTFIIFLSIMIPISSANIMKWWKTSLSVQGLVIVYMLIASFTNLSANISFINTILPVSILSSISVLLTSILQPYIDGASENKDGKDDRDENSPLKMPEKHNGWSSTMKGGWKWLTPILSTISFMYFAITYNGGGNIILGMLSMLNIIKNLFKNNLARLLITLVMIGYFIIYFRYSIPQMASWLGGGTNEPYTGTLKVLNVLWISLGILLSMLFFSASVTKIPPTASFLERIKIILSGNYLIAFGKILLILATIVLIPYIFFTLIGSSTMAVNIMTLTIQIVTGIAILYGILKFIISKPHLLSAIMNNSFIKLLYNVIFIIPCVLVYLTEEIFSKGTKTGIHLFPEPYVWKILCVEIMLITSYILMPMFRQKAYLFNAGKPNHIQYSERLSGVQKALFNEEEKLLKMASIGETRIKHLDWEGIYTKELYKKDAEHVKALNSYLKSKGYKNNYGIRDNVFINDILGRPITLHSLISFIQTNNQVESIVDQIMKVAQFKNKLSDLEKEEKENIGPSTSKILLNKPTYINKTKHLGIYENLKKSPTGLGADDYNYNYGLSSWIFIMAQGAEFGLGYSKFTKILDYGGKPTIWYNPDKHTLRITTKMKKNNNVIDKKIYETKDFKLQKWNNIVINYIGGTLDIFINKQLVSSIQNIIPYMSSDQITIGDIHGISGSVSNVTYFAAPITKGRIDTFYDMLVNKDPPTV